LRVIVDRIFGLDFSNFSISVFICRLSRGRSLGSFEALVEEGAFFAEGLLEGLEGNRVERDARACDVVATVALFDVLAGEGGHMAQF
jgi:hypothetical protein